MLKNKFVYDLRMSASSYPYVVFISIKILIYINEYTGSLNPIKFNLLLWLFVIVIIAYVQQNMDHRN